MAESIVLINNSDSNLVESRVGTESTDPQLKEKVDTQFDKFKHISPTLIPSMECDFILTNLRKSEHMVNISPLIKYKKSKYKRRVTKYHK